MTLRRALPAVVASALLASGCGLIGGGGGSYDVTVYFPRAVALYQQGQVRVLGLPAGHVTDIETESQCPLDPAKPSAGSTPCVRVELTLDDDVELPADVAATLIPQSLIGERYVQLAPAYTDADAQDGKPTLQSLPDDERVIPLNRAVIPVEPDEALKAVNDFLKSLDPNGLGRLIGNLSEDLRGNGPALNSAIGSLSDVLDTLASKDDELASIVDNFDEFTRTIVTREGQIGELIDSFARTSHVLAEERNNLENLLAGLAQVSSDGLDLVSEHAAALRTDLDTLSRVGQSLVANLDSVSQLVDSGPILTTGLSGAFNPQLRAMNLVTSLGPLAFNVLNPVLRSLLGFDLGCIQIDTVCVGSDAGLLGTGLLSGQSADGTTAAVTSVPAARTPVDDVLSLLGSPLRPSTGSVDAADHGTGDKVADGAGAVGRFLRNAAESLVGAG